MRKQTMLSQTNSGNWAKEVTISKGGKWSFVGNFGTLEAANAAADIQRTKGRLVSVTEEATSQSQSKKCHERAVSKAVSEAAANGLRGEELKAVAAAVKPLPVGHVFWRVDAYIARTKQVMTHASAAECAAAGRTPGRCND